MELRELHKMILAHRLILIKTIRYAKSTMITDFPVFSINASRRKFCVLSKRKLESSRICCFATVGTRHGHGPIKTFRYAVFHMHCFPCFHIWSSYINSNKNVPLQSSRPPPPPQCFNGWAGPCCNPMYAPRASGPDMCGYHNYQPPWQQPLPQEQQMAPSRASVAYQ